MTRQYLTGQEEVSKFCLLAILKGSKEFAFSLLWVMIFQEGKGKKHKPIPEALIQARAYEIWKTRQREGKDGSPEKDWEQARAYLESGRLEQVLIWTGFEGKRLWDWLKLLIVPVVLGIVAFGLQECAKQGDQELADDQARQETLAKYVEQMNDLLIDKKLRENNSNPEVFIIAQLATATTLRELDVKRQDLLFQFLRTANLYNPPEEKGALLRGIVLNFADLNFADLNFANLNFANLSYAKLIQAKLIQAKLSHANLSHANLSQANLSQANLSQANLSQVNLKEANLKEADLSNVIGLTNEQIKSACYWNKAIYKDDKKDNEQFIKGLGNYVNDNRCNKLWNR